VGKGGRGRSGSNGKGKSKGNDTKATWESSNRQDAWDGYGDEQEWDESQWHDTDGWQDKQTHSPSGRDKRQGAADNSFGMHESSLAGQWQDGQLARPLAAQWRFVCRVLQRHAPEERVHDVRRQIQLGDHVFVQYSWDFVETHAIVCSSASEEGGRRNNREDPYWVVYWSQETRQLACKGLSEFSKGGELFRVSYPHWVCQCYVPASTTMKPHISEEFNLEADRSDAVAKRANTSFRSGTWAPSWSQDADIEFCIQTKTGSSAPIEIHGRKTLASKIQWPFGCWVGGDRKPSVLFGVGRAGGAGAGGAHTPSSPTRSPVNRAREVPPMPQALDGFGGVWDGSQAWQGGWQAPPMVAPPMGAPMVAPTMSGIAAALYASKSMSADAQEFIMPGMASNPPVNLFQGMLYQ